MVQLVPAGQELCFTQTVVELNVGLEKLRVLSHSASDIGFIYTIPTTKAELPHGC